VTDTIVNVPVQPDADAVALIAIPSTTVAAKVNEYEESSRGTVRQPMML
jgi:hypothetical protein